MLQPHSQFIDWYNSLKVVKANNDPANGNIATAFVVLTRWEENFDLNFDSHIAEDGMQIKVQKKLTTNESTKLKLINF